MMAAIAQAPELQQFMIFNARPTGRHLGVGSYGRVLELDTGGLVCAGKVIHEALVQPDNVGFGSIVRKYVEECSLMSSLRHPHIVQFLGICALGDSPHPVLVMEMLLTSLDELLEKTPNIPISIKRSILEDVSVGLVYLHSRNPQIIHRDLTAKNVLLNSAMVAKISDLGNSRIVNLQPSKLAATLSRFPGTLVYMPPEASCTHYGPGVDIFSLGHLALYTIIQVFPGDLLPPTVSDPVHPDKVCGLTEVERRRQYIERLYQQLGADHPLSQLVKQCLHNNPSHRPSSRGVLQQLRNMKKDIPDPYERFTKIDMIGKLETEASMASQELRSLRSQLYNLQRGPSQSALEAQLRERDATITHLMESVRTLQVENSRMLQARETHQNLMGWESQLKQRETDVVPWESHLKEREADVVQWQSHLKEREANVVHRESRLNQREAHLKEGEADVVHRESQLKQREADVVHRESQLKQREADVVHRESRLKQREADVVPWESHLKQREADVVQWQSHLKEREANVVQWQSQLKEREADVEQWQSHLKEREAHQQVYFQQRETELQEQFQNLELHQSQEVAPVQQDPHRNVSDAIVREQQARLRKLQNTPHAQPPNTPKVSEEQVPVHQAKPEDIKLRPGAELEWQQCTDLPISMSNAQAVYLNDKVYVGGGDTQTEYVYIYNIDGNKWAPLRTPTRHPALTTYQSQLLLVGGQLVSTDLITNQLWLLQDNWNQPLPPMRTKRMGASATCSQHNLVVAGGKESTIYLCNVEIFNGQQWMEVEPLPRGCIYMKPILHRGIIYLSGGKSQLQSVFYANLKSLINKSQQSAWKTLPDVPHNLCSGTVFQGALVAIGGIDSATESDATATTSPLHMYSPATQTWDKVAEMPFVIDSTCAVTLPSGEMMIIGGKRDNFLPNVYKVISRN